MSEYLNKFELAEETIKAAENNHAHWQQEVKGTKEVVQEELDTSVTVADSSQGAWLVMLKKVIDSLKEQLERAEVEGKQQLKEGKQHYNMYWSLPQITCTCT